MSFITETYGRYTIKSGPLAGAWAANAFRGRALITKASGETREGSLASVKSELDRLDRQELSERDIEGAPSAREYERAFVILLPKMADSYVAMLRAHLRSPNQLISATELAKAAGYSGYEGANLHYGKLAQRVADEIGFDPPRRKDGSVMWTCAIARDPSVDTDYPDTSMLEALSRNFDLPFFEWQMRPQVVAALKALGF